MEDTYNPEKLVYNYRKLPRGKARAEAIRYAINQADLNNDTPYMVFFREKFCEEAGWYADSLDLVTVFPELLALVDRYPDIEPVPFQYRNIIKEVLWDYAGLLEVCEDFYQITLDDGIKFHNDYLKRYTACGYSAREPYRMIFEFYCKVGDVTNAVKYFTAFKNCIPGSDNCKGCDTNSEIFFYLSNNEKEKADRLAAKIEDGTIRCSSDADNGSFSLLRLKVQYIEYYICSGDYKKAAECAAVLEHNKSSEKEFNPWGNIMCAYVYDNPGRGLRIYKKHWREWEEEISPKDKFMAYKCCACFFEGLKKSKDTNSIKLRTDKTFPLYNEEGIYNLDSLVNYYYKRAEEIAKKFDQRNGTDKYTKELIITYNNALAYKREG